MSIMPDPSTTKSIIPVFGSCTARIENSLSAKIWASAGLQHAAFRNLSRNGEVTARKNFVHPVFDEFDDSILLKLIWPFTALCLCLLCFRVDQQCGSKQLISASTVAILHFALRTSQRFFVAHSFLPWLELDKRCWSFGPVHWKTSQKR